MSVILLGFKPDQLSDEQVARVQEAAPEMRVMVSRDKDEIEKHLDDLEVVAGGFPREFFAKAKNLRWYQQWGAGADWLMKHPEVAELDFTLTNASGVHAIPISEHIIAFLLAFARQLPQALRAQGRREWLKEPQETVFELAGKTMLLVGVGAIGARTAVIAEALGMRVLGVRRNPEGALPGVEAMFGPDKLLGLLPEADVVVLTVPLTRETEGMVGERELRAMKRAAYLINIGRGGTIQEDMLARALKEGWIAGAGLDVFETEPLPESSLLWDLTNIVITSHYSGSTPEYNARGLEIFLDNLARYKRGEPLRNVVDKKLGY